MLSTRNVLEISRDTIWLKVNGWEKIMRRIKNIERQIIDQWNRNRFTDMSNWFLKCEQKQSSGERIVFSINCPGTIAYKDAKDAKEHISIHISCHKQKLTQNALST